MFHRTFLHYGSSQRGPGVVRAKQQRQQQPAEPDIPQPPPTVAPPQGPTRKPLPRSAYRQARKTEEQREKERAQAAAAAKSAGATYYLDRQALQARHAAVSAGGSSSLAGKPAPAAAAAASRSGFRSAASTAVTVIDGYNFLHYHPTTKRFMTVDQVDQARAMLHKLLAAYAAQQQEEFRVVYDATTVSASGEDRVYPIGNYVQVMFRAGHDADSVIIDAVKALQEQAAAAAAAGLPARGSAGQRVTVVTNDRRIQSACSEADVLCQGNAQLSRDLQLLENRLASFNQGVKVDNPAAAAAAVAAAAAEGRRRPAALGAAPSINQDTYAWAKRVLADRAAASSSSSSSSSRKQSRHRQQRQQQQRAHSPDQLLSDEELLQQAKAAAAVEAAAEAASPTPSGITVSSTSQALDDLLRLDDLDDF
uniref:NYN domain-containing protein n=1 Tax=Tetradesmus obliquus TaxID=3088 RepID=A0A383VCX3_TETOB|eukprot:jgi/Sobl393_1/9048/SZX62494.1